MLELIIALFLSLGIISSGEDLTNQHIQNNQDIISTHVIDDDYVVQ